MSFNIGLNIVETDGKATPSIQAAETSVPGFIIRSERGVLDEVIKITSKGQFRDHFGSFFDDAYGAYAVHGFFDNGGSAAHVTRVTASGNVTTAAHVLIDSFATVNLDTDPDESLVFDLDGTTLTATFRWIPASLTGSETETYNLEDSAVGKTIGFIINDVPSDHYKFDGSTDFPNSSIDAASADDVAAVLNREFTGIKVTANGAGTITVETDRGDKYASINVIVDNAVIPDASNAGITIFGTNISASGGANANVSYIDAVTPDVMATVLTDELGDGVVVSREGQNIKITHAIPGAGHTLTLDENSTALGPDPLNQRFTFSEQDGTDAGTGSGPTTASKNFGDLKITAGYQSKQDPGSWGEDIKIEILDNFDTVSDAELFDINVWYKGTTDREHILVESWSDLRMNPPTVDQKGFYITNIINDEYTGSKYILVELMGNARPANIAATNLENGSDGAAPVNLDYKASVKRFEKTVIQLLCCPESHDSMVVNECLTHCALMQDRMFIGHTPRGMEANTIKGSYSDEFRGNKLYGALYFAWLQVADPLGTYKIIPPTGHILGTYARIANERGIWKAPAGNEARLRNVINIDQHISDKEHTDLVKQASVNAVRFISGQGIVIDSSRTLSTNPLWFYVNVRQLFNFVKSSLKNSLRWVVQEPNDTTLWNNVKYNSVTPFLMGLWRQGAFGPGTPEEVFEVIIDSDNNRPEQIQLGYFTAEIYFYPSRPVESFIMKIGQHPGGVTSSES